MQSFGDDTLLACIDIEKKHQILEEQAEAPLQKENVSDLSKYFKSCSLLSDFANDENDVSNPKPLDSKGMKEGENTSELAKYFEDSIIFPKVNSRRNLSASTSGASRRNGLLLSQRNRSPRKTNKENVDTNLKEKHRSGTADDTEKRDESDIHSLCKNKSPDNAQDATSSSGVRTSSAVDATYDGENSEFVILSPPLCTQDRCKLALWGLPPNILQVSYNTLNIYLCINNY